MGLDGEIDVGPFQENLSRIRHIDSKQSMRDNISIVTAARFGYILEKGLQKKLMRNDKWEKGSGEVMGTLILEGMLPELRTEVRQQL